MFASKFRKLLIAAAFLLPLAPAAEAAEEGLLTIDAIAGLVQVQRDGSQYSLREGDSLQAGDVLLTDTRGRATVSLARHGFIELGGNAQVAFDALPHSSYSRDLKTVFNLAKGYLRVVWKRPQSATAWPLYVVMGSTRAVLGSGEYFFQAGTEPRLCAAAGVLAVQTRQTPEPVRPPACATVKADASLAISARNPDDWIAVRRAYSVRAGEPVIVEVAAAAPVAEAAPAAPLAAQLPPPKPGMDYSLLEEAGQPGISTSAGASARTTPLPAAAPVIVAEAPELPATPNRFEVASSPVTNAATAVIPDLTAAPKATTPAAAKPGRGRANCFMRDSCMERSTSPLRRMPREVPLTSSITPLRAKACKCSSAALADLKPSSVAISARVGGAPVRAMAPWIRSRICCWRAVSLGLSSILTPSCWVGAGCVSVHTVFSSSNCIFNQFFD